MADRNERGQFYSGMKGAHTTHGLSKTRFFRIYINMHTRCENPNTRNYAIYGGKGIKVLWNSFEDFRDDMYESYLKHVKEFGEKNTSIDRIDNNASYFKKNCRWATMKEQARNTTQNKPITFNGKTQTLGAWADDLGLCISTLNSRKTKGWSIKRMLTSKKYERNT